MKIVVRQETNEDFEKVYEVVKTAFLNAEHTNNDEQNLVVRLRKSAAFIPELSLVAVIDDKIVGHIMFTKIKIKNGTEEFESLVLAPVSVVPEMQDKGIGTKNGTRVRLYFSDFSRASKLLPAFRLCSCKWIWHNCSI